MQEKTQKPNIKLVDPDTLDQLKSLLPKRYYGEFQQEFANSFGKKAKIPTRQSVHQTLYGIRYNHDIMVVLNAMAEKRLELKKKVKETLESVS